MLHRITRRGFRGRYITPAQREYAEAFVRELAEEQNVLAELRPVSYCGPGSAGDRGAAMLSVHGAETGFQLVTIEAGGRAS